MKRREDMTDADVDALFGDLRNDALDWNPEYFSEATLTDLLEDYFGLEPDYLFDAEFTAAVEGFGSRYE